MFNFKDSSVGRFLIIDTSILEEDIIAFIKENNISNILINDELGYSLSTMEPFCNLEGIKKIWIVADELSLKGIENFIDLEFLYCSLPLSNSIDLSIFTKLEDLTIPWSNGLFNLDKLSSLKDLTLSNVKGDISAIGKLKELERLTINKSNFEKLDFIKDLKNLKYLALSHATKLKDISGIIGLENSLLELRLQSCKKINYESVLSKIKNLEKLILSRSSDLESVSFVKELTKLKFFSFVDTKIIDGNLKALTGIEYLGFMNKKHYSHKLVDGKLIKK